MTLSTHHDWAEVSGSLPISRYPAPYSRGLLPDLPPTYSRLINIECANLARTKMARLPSPQHSGKIASVSMGLKRIRTPVLIGEYIKTSYKSGNAYCA